uniref:Solute carrier family 7 member 14b n=1 Tax=Oryzias sinensis TaxID=183150 RepID=A0A8C7XBK2_9TELE
MMSIGTLLAYTLVSVCVLLLRYQPDEQTDTHQFRVEEDEVTRCTLLFFITSFFLWSTVIYGVEQGSGVGAVFSGLMATLMAASLVKLMVLILQQPESTRRLPYMAPCVPFVPGAAILVNSYLMLKLSPLTWARFTIWCIIGLLIYGCYGVWHSTLELNAREQQAHASSYQRYDDHLDDTFSPDDSFSAETFRSFLFLDKPL